MLGYDSLREYLFKKTKDTVMKQSYGHYPAPLGIIEVVRTGIEKGGEAGYDAESRVSRRSFVPPLRESAFLPL